VGEEARLWKSGQRATDAASLKDQELVLHGEKVPDEIANQASLAAHASSVLEEVAWADHRERT
jgi:hypothetical protein